MHVTGGQAISTNRDRMTLYAGMSLVVKPLFQLIGIIWHCMHTVLSTRIISRSTRMLSFKHRKHSVQILVIP